MENFANEAGTAGKDPVNIVAALLRELSVPVTDATIRDSLLSHPNYPSLLCVSDSLEQWGLDTMALDIAPSGLSHLPCPFLAHCPTVGDDPYWIVKSAGDDGLVCMDSRRRIRPVAFQDFCGVWDGKVLVMEKRAVYGEADYPVRRRAERWGRMRIVLGVLVLLLPMVAALRVYVREGGDGGYFSALLAGNILGVVLVLLLQGYEYGWAGAGLKRWCSLNGKMSCAAVLQSRGARLWKDVSWGDLGLVYFAGSLAYGWLVAYGGLSPEPLVLCNYLSVGYVVFSLLYQGLVVRKWCFLCLLVQGVLVGEGLAALVTGQPAGLADGMSFVFVQAIAGVSWILLKPLWVRSMEAVVLRRGLTRLKRNELVFRGLLGSEDALKSDPGGVGLVIGDGQAERSLVLVSNPYCAPCGKMHQKLERLLEKDRRWKVRIIFSIAGQDEDAVGAVRSFFHAADTGGEAGLRRALHDWYGEMKKGAEGIGTDKRIAEMADWCRKEEIRYTPAVFVDGRRLPEPYDIGDLQFL
jgi:hypothetical protein